MSTTGGTPLRDPARPRGLLVPLVLLALLVAGCGANGTSPGAQTVDQDAGLCADGQREFSHQALARVESVCIPADPQRIAVFDVNMTSFMLQVGVEPVAHWESWITSLRDSHPELSDDIDGFVSDSVAVDGADGLNLEALAAAEPDLVLTAAHYIADVRDEIEAIAPVVAYDYEADPAADWGAILDLYASAVRLDDEASSALDAVDTRIEALAAELDDQDGEAVSLLTNYTGELSVLLSEWPVSRIIDAVGLARPASQGADAAEAAGNGYSAPLSRERVGDADADHLFIVQVAQDDGGKASAQIEELRESPLYRSMDVVSSSNDHVVGGHWVFGGIYDIHRTIDDLFTHVAEVDPAEVSPNPLLVE